MSPYDQGRDEADGAPRAQVLTSTMTTQRAQGALLLGPLFKERILAYDTAGSQGWSVAVASFVQL